MTDRGRLGLRTLNRAAPGAAARDIRFTAPNAPVLAETSGQRVAVGGVATQRSAE